jgi:glutathione peroxidase-family protein
MIIVFLVISILITIACIIGYNLSEYYYNDSWFFGIVTGIILLIINIILLCVFTNQVKNLDIIDKKIEMYQEENNKIESDIDVLVKQYMEHEKSTLKEFKTESSITLVNLYPDLKSNELVKQQINIYTENNNKIKELKEKKLNYQVSKWWLYFGKVE